MKLITLVLFCALVAGCDGAVDTAYKEQIVVNAFLFAGSPIDSVVLHRTTPFGDSTGDLAYAVDSADVQVIVDGAAYQLLPGNRKGRYYLPANMLIVQPGKTYELKVNVGHGVHYLDATTTVPSSIRDTGLALLARGQTITIDTNNLKSFQGLLVQVAPQDHPWRQYILEVHSLDTLQPRIPEGRNGPPQDTTQSTHYSFLQQGPNLPVYPQLFSHYGPNRITSMALDSNFVDYFRQLSPGNGGFQQSLNHVNGGLGVWASAARDTLTIFLKQKQ